MVLHEKLEHAWRVAQIAIADGRTPLVFLTEIRRMFCLPYGEVLSSTSNRVIPGKSRARAGQVTASIISDEPYRAMYPDSNRPIGSSDAPDLSPPHPNGDRTNTGYRLFLEPCFLDIHTYDAPVDCTSSRWNNFSLSLFLKREQELCHSINAETTINRQSVNTVENVACINRSKTKTGEALVTDVENWVDSYTRSHSRCRCG